LFAGADTGGERAAAIYSLIRTDKLNGVDPEDWLRHVLANIADHPVNRVDEFPPWHCAVQLAPSYCHLVEALTIAFQHASMVS
jgi:transposase